MDLLHPTFSAERKKRLVRFASSVCMLMVVCAALGALAARYPLVPGTPTPKQFPHAGPRQAIISAVTPPIIPVTEPELPVAKDKVAFTENLSAEAVLAVDNDTNTVLFRKNVTTPRSLASITKLMTALVLTDLQISWKASSTVVDASDLDSSSHHLKAGDKLTLEQLWNVALVGSDNAAIRILVRMSGLTTEQFVARMNEKAKSLNLASAQFVEPTGLDSKNIANALDVARLLKAALAVDHIKNTLEQGEYDVGDKNRRVFSTNLLLTDWIPNSFGRGAVVGKTGYIQDSGYNFTVRLSRDDSHAIRVVVLGAASGDARFSEARDVGNFVFTHYLWPGDSGYSNARSAVLADAGGSHAN